MSNPLSETEGQQQDARQYWDERAASFDEEPDHGLRDPGTLEAWTQLIRTWLPPTPISILDVGCGTGSLSVVLARLGHTVTGIDLSPAMISCAETKAAAAGQWITFHVMDAALPAFAPGQFDMLVCRHLLWALPNLAQVLRRWAELLKPCGCLLLIEGFWNTGGGLHAAEIVEVFPPSLTNIVVHDLSAQSAYWGKVVGDERYLIIAYLRP
jgi:2-polyprenyl-3-methyl-5-hydroxy-6-metoxy-1,4-benzoquinol methylase